MTLQAIREFLQQCLAMRLAVTILTFLNVFMACMTFCAGYLSVFALRILELIVYGAVTGSTYFIRSIFRILDDQRSVCRMADKAILDGLACRMRFMAFHARRYKAVFAMVTQRTGYL